MTKIRVLVVEDSVTVRKYLVECLQSDPEICVVAEAEDGKQAIELCERLRPDVVTLDMMLPVMTGLSATEYIMAYCPTPIVIVSASMNRGEVLRTYEALAAGALDVIDKPVGDISDEEWSRKLISLVKLVSRVKVITHPRARLRRSLVNSSVSSSAAGNDLLSTQRSCSCVAMGASTGGPQTLAAILGALPGNFPLPILLIMHISASFGASFAEWLNDQSAVPVRVAEHDQLLPMWGTPGVILSPPDRHLIVRGNRLLLTNDAEVHSCRPSVDVLFRSVAEEIGQRAIGVLLTGMGRDGAQGLLAMRKAGSTTIVQDEETSIIFGMPREAIELGAATRVLPLGAIAPELVALSELTGFEEPKR